MLVLNEHQFISNLEGIVGAAKNIVVASYGKIEGYPDGLTDCTTATGKQLRIVVGGGMFNGVVFERFLNFHSEASHNRVVCVGPIAYPSPFSNTEEIQASKDAGVATVTEELSEVSKSTLVILYTGTSRLNDMVTLGASLAEKGARIVIYGCGCDESTRFAAVDNFPNKKNVVVIPEAPKATRFCDSGYSELGDVVKHLL
jgi:hypothetical protein